MRDELAIVAGIVGGPFVVFLIYVFSGNGLRLFRSQAYCYRNLASPTMSDEDFAAAVRLLAPDVPAARIIECRLCLARCLDFPAQHLRPEMPWNEIPLHKSCNYRDTEVIEFIIEDANGGEYAGDVLDRSTVGDIVALICSAELEMRKPLF